MKRYLLAILILLIGCAPKCSSIDLFFQTLDKKLSESEKNIIKKCPDVGCLTMFVHSKILEKFSDAYHLTSDQIDGLLKDSLKIVSANDRSRILIVAYQSKLNGKSIDFIKIMNKIAQYDKFQEINYTKKNKNEIQKHVDLAKRNFNRFHLGDTLNLTFSLGHDGNRKTVYYYKDYNKSNFEDTLFVRCVLLKKTMEREETSKYSHDEYYFVVRILNAKNEELNLVEKKYQDGNIITVPLFDYGRIIN